MKIKPLADRVVVQPQEAETKTASGPTFPTPQKKNPNVEKS